MKTSQDDIMLECIRNCKECHDICEQTLMYCLRQGGPHAEVRHIQTLLDCAQCCHVCEDFMLRESSLHPRVCAICAECCTRCADSCEKLDPNDAQMQKCARTCRQCADACKKVTQMAQATA